MKVGMNVRGELMQLEKGHIAYDEYGDPDGMPVIFCHGWPSSRSMARLTDAAARDLGVRIISADRPGISGSAFQADRKLIDWPGTVQALCEKLEISNFHVLGISGGAPYAYATAWALPGQVKAVAVVSGAPPIAELPDHNSLVTLQRWMLAMHARRPGLLRALFRVARPIARLRPPLRLRPMMLRIFQPGDADVLRDTAAFEACFESARQAWRGSVLGVIADAELYALPWGFPLEEVSARVALWHGTDDRMFSFHLAEGLVPRFQNGRLRLVDGAGHFSLPIRHIHEILADLIAPSRLEKEGRGPETSVSV